MHQPKSIKELQKGWKIASASLCLILIVIMGFAISIASSFPGTQANTIEKIGVGIYQDLRCEKSFDQIVWGKINIGSVASQTIYVRNELDLPCLLSLSALNWFPLTASKYLTLDWNYSGQRVAPGQIIPLELTLTVSKNVLDIIDFSFKIRIAANQ
jgi:hypothetical protein